MEDKDASFLASRCSSSPSTSLPSFEKEALRAAFSRVFGQSPTLICTAPGRVNLIGEHVDYSGYSVFPFALNQSINICASLVEGTGNIVAFSSLMSTSVSVCSDDGENSASIVRVRVNCRFPELQGTLKATSWTDFLLCGIYSRILLGKAKGEVVDFSFPDNKDLLLYIDSSIPPAAGLSSSSALVVAMSLAVCKLLPPIAPYEVLEFVSSCIEAERLIGTLGGGMDQSASVMARESHLMHIHFRPKMAVDHVAFPSDRLAMVVANSFVSAEKSQGAKFEFNKRFIECKLSAIVISKHLKKSQSLDASNNLSFEVNSLSDIEDIISANSLSSPSSTSPTDETSDTIALKIANLERCLSVAESVLKRDGYSILDLCEALDVAVTPNDTGSENSPLWSLYFSSRAAAKEVLNKGYEDPSNKMFNLFSRALHVWQETIRVLKVRLICDKLAASSSRDVSSSTTSDAKVEEEILQQELGVLMNSSHESLKIQYECSHEQLDHLVDTCRSLGALGARLTGAGWGGCVVALICKKDEENFVRRLKESEFYKGVADGMDLNLNVFSTAPSRGADATFM